MASHEVEGGLPRASVEGGAAESIRKANLSSPPSTYDEHLADIGDVEQRKKISSSSTLNRMHKLGHSLARFNVEKIGITPLLDSERVATQWWSVGFLWFSANFNVLAFSTGSLAPLLGLGMYSALFTILGFCFLCAIPPAYLTTFGPKLGLRQMVLTRYSWGYFPTSLICLLNAATMIGYCILNSILGGSTLSALSDGESLSPAVGIVIVCIISLVISFCGIKVLHWVERWIWLPTMVTFIVLIATAGTGPTGLHIPEGPDPTTAKAVLTMGAIIAGFLLAYSPLSSDMSHYLHPSTSSWKLFSACFLGFFISSAPIMMLGAAFAISAQDIASWEAAIEISNGAFFNLVMAENPTFTTVLRGFGKFCVLILGLSTIPNICLTFYSFGLTFQTMLPFLTPFPRFIWPILATVIVLPLGIVGASYFYTTLTNFTSVLGYWAALYNAVILTEHIVIRRCRFATYDRSAWNDWRKLPPGFSPMAAAILTLGLLIPCVDQVWFSGPLAEMSGDLGFEVGLVLCALLYVPLRLVEKHLLGR